MMKEKIAYIGIENVCQVWIQNESRETEPLSYSVLDKTQAHDTFSSLWKNMNDDEKSYIQTLLHEEQKWASENDEEEHLYVYTKTLEVIDQKENHYYKLFISEDGVNGRWNIIQVKGDPFQNEARYYVLKGDIENPEPIPHHTIGWLTHEEQGLWFTDGEDYTLLEEWEKVDGTLITF